MCGDQQDGRWIFHFDFIFNWETLFSIRYTDLSFRSSSNGFQDFDIAVKELNGGSRSLLCE